MQLFMLRPISIGQSCHCMYHWVQVQIVVILMEVSDRAKNSLTWDTSLMDEASGNFYGKQLIRAYYFKTMPDCNWPKELKKQFDLICRYNKRKCLPKRRTLILT